MLDIVYERHSMLNPQLPFIFHTDFCLCRSGGVANWHDNTEFLFCLDGEGNVSIDGKDILMKTGDTVIINAGCLHSISAKELVKYHCLIIDNSFFTDNGIDIYSLAFCEKVCDSKCREISEKAATLFGSEKQPFSVAEIRLCLLEFVCHVCRNYSRTKAGRPAKVSKGYEAVLDTIGYINNHFSEKLTLEDISSRAGFSKYHFTRIFKENTGVSVVEHINARRCDNARFLLRETSKTIAEISLECGFESSSYFAKAFSRFYGDLPSEYRKKHSKL